MEKAYYIDRYPARYRLTCRMDNKRFDRYVRNPKQAAVISARLAFPRCMEYFYLLMGIAFYRVWIAVTTAEKRKEAFLFYGAQLLFNFLWPIIFFNLQEYLFAFVWLAILWLVILMTQQRFSKIDLWAGYLLIPYLAWVAFAGYLNLGIWWLN